MKKNPSISQCSEGFKQTFIFQHNFLHFCILKFFFILKGENNPGIKKLKKEKDKIFSTLPH